jgi:choloylglycine hydrolase
MRSGLFFLLGGLLSSSVANACTGISLQAQDGTAIVGRTVEWALNDSEHHRLLIVPRGKSFVSQTPDGRPGKRWQGRHGFVSLTSYGQPYGPDGLNEQGLSVGMFYFPGFASYAAYDPDSADSTLSLGDFMQWMLSSFSTVEDVRRALPSVSVVNVDDPNFHGVPMPFHWKIADASGASIVVEITHHGDVNVFDAFRGVITNSPAYDWHLTNLRNYLGLSPDAQNALSIDQLELSPLGAGSGMIGLPGDFTPPARFVRAAALTASVRPLATAGEAVFEGFRILDSFNIPLGAITPRDKMPTDIVGATQITSVSDLRNRRYYFTTMRNREVRMIDLQAIDFANVREQMIDGDEGRINPVRALTVAP